MNQLVNHLDKIKEMSGDEFTPKVIIRTAVGSTEPLYPGIQHCSDYTSAFRLMLKEVCVAKLYPHTNIVKIYERALKRDGSTLIIEKADDYGGE